jgi:DNA recombination protein Rad52
MFSEDQKAALNAPLSSSLVKSRKQGGRDVSYIEGWKAVEEANRIFGFDGWTRETVEIKCVSEGERKIGKENTPGYGVTYIVKVRVMVGNVCREGCGAGHGIDRDLGQAHESAIKEAETDAMKRALMTFGNPFGLALYDKTKANVADEPDSRQLFVTECLATIAKYADAGMLGGWWNSDQQKQARRDFDLDSTQVELLKQAVIRRREELTKAKAA